MIFRLEAFLPMPSNYLALFTDTFSIEKSKSGLCMSFELVLVVGGGVGGCGVSSTRALLLFGCS